MPAFDSRCSAAAAHHQVVVSPPLPLPHPRPLHRPPPPRRRPGTLRYGCLPRRSSTSSSQIVAAATPEGVVVANFAGDEIDRIHPLLRHLQLPISDSFKNRSTSSSQIVATATPEGIYGGLITELSEARKVDAVTEVVREMM
ncbi:hypothetical protein SASPL_130360 [Salvia splendens]|uniref:Uncharacterized protein n=1 Tax=Salvia splendens TaxID=180675 RepID=A0A8X8X8T6_SALSN|nr:hypothetical protein SASPL_130360 [Salvia splendens]